MYDVLDVAKYMINYSIDSQSPISNLKLQKILYYVQAAFLVEKNKQCFASKIVAWAFGPVVPEVYQEYKMYGRNNLPKQEKRCTLAFDPNQMKIVRERKQDGINAEDKMLINKVLDAYSEIKDPFQLVRKTHAEGPWKETAENQEITCARIKNYYINKREEIYNN